MLKLFLDDVRNLPDNSWILVRTIDEAKGYLMSGLVSDLSLDNDLGIKEIIYCNYHLMEDFCLTCDDCLSIMHEEGYKLVDWIEATGFWPTNKPTVHSQNSVRADYMRKIIDKHYEE